MQRLNWSRLASGGALVAGLLALVAAPSCSATGASGGDCADGLATCNGECIDPRSNPQHCGGCNAACPAGSACENGSCGGCADGFLDCGAGCVDVKVDPKHCGACGFGCAEGAACTDGVCGVACLDGYEACGDACVDTQSDAKHCGGCDTTCRAGEYCVEGSCRPCPARQTQCGSACVDTQTDAANCGDCGNRCPEHFVCVEGDCEDDCGPGLDLCGGVCVSTQSDPTNCGSCDNACEPGFLCVGGICQSRCAEGQIFCAGQCVDPQDNAYHCGTCFNSCDLYYTCEAGACRNPCTDGLDPCDGGCTDLQGDSNNCGGCNVVCAPGLSCQMGVCACAGASVCQLCQPQDLGRTVPQTVSGTTEGGLDSYSPTCSSDGVERGFSFTPPTNGSYTFSLAGSSYDTLLAILSDACAQTGCNDDSGGLQSLITTTLTSDRTVHVVVDGYSGASGAFTLSISGGTTCSATTFAPTVPSAVTGTTAGAADVLTPSCGAAGGRDVRYTFTAPADGTYTFDTIGSSFNTVLHVRDGACAGPELACNDDTGGPQSQVAVTLTAGQTVSVVVDGAGAAASGAFTLNVH